MIPATIRSPAETERPSTTATWHTPAATSPGPARRALAFLGAAALVACAGGGTLSPTTSRSSGDSSVVVNTTNGLRQTLRLSSNPVATGDTLVVESVLFNGGSTPVRAWQGYGCRLDVVETDLQLAGPVCLAPTYEISLAPGDSTRGSEHGVVASPTGRYPLRVRQTVDTSFSAEIDVVVTSP